MRPRSITLAASVAAFVAQSLSLATPALAATTNVPFTSTGAEQTWAVPAGVSIVHVVLIGGRGGGFSGGGFGGRVEGDLGVAGMTTLYIEVGGNGALASGISTGGGFNGGGNGGISASNGYGGGGASDIRTISRSAMGSTGSRLVVAAGGGGDGGGVPNAAGGNAGSAGASGLAGGGGGAAGTLNGAGAGGVGSSFNLNGGNGGLSVGGSGVSGAATDLGAGGGGGSGYFGGGAGGGSTFGPGGGGGGGASYAGGLAGPAISVDSSGVPSITISYDSGPGPTPTPPPNSGTVDATVAMAPSAVCLELSATAIDFGTRQFGDVGIAANPGVTVTNCGGLGEDVLAHGSDASGAGPIAWTLNDTGTCLGGTLPADNFGLAIERQDTNAQIRLSSVNKALETLSGGAAIDHLARIDTPCPGSTGAGVVMSMQMTFVATESLP